MAPTSGKLDTATLFERLFATYRAQFGLLVPAAVLVFLPVALLEAFVRSEPGDPALLLVGVAVSLVATFWLQGMAVEAVRDIQDGRRDFTLGGLFRSITPVIGALVLAGLIAGFGVALGFVALIVPGLILLTIWALVAPVVVIERSGALGALGRSRELVRGNGFRVFGVIVVVFLIQGVLGALLAGVLNADESALGAGASSLLSNALIAPLAAIAAALLYLELRRLRGEPPISAGEGPPRVAPERPY